MSDVIEKRYAVGFAFNEARSCVLLVEKDRPQWQAGLWNGVGGHVEPGEPARQAMEREFTEETGLVHDDWDHLCTVKGSDWILWYFKAFDVPIFSARQQPGETERVRPHYLTNLPKLPMLNNARWAAFACLDDKNAAFVVQHHTNSSNEEVA